MTELLEKTFYEQMTMPSSSCAICGIKEIEERLEKNKKILKSNLSKKERKLLLRIIDDKDLMNEQKTRYQFIHGFKTGLQIGYESNR